MQGQSCELSFIWGLIMTVAWETVSHLCETALKRWGEVSVYIYDFSEGELCVVKHTFWQKVAASHEEQMLSLMMLMLF